MLTIALNMCCRLFCLLAFAVSWHAANAQFHAQYIPGQQVVPMLFGKGMTRLSGVAQGSISAIDFRDAPIGGFHLDGAYALDRCWGLVGSLDLHRMDATTEYATYFSSGAPPRKYTERDQGRWSYGELGAGRYRVFDDNWVGEVYGLFGYGTTWNEWPDGWWTRTRMHGVSAQANIGRVSGFFEWALVNRLRFFTISDIRTGGSLDEEDPRDFELVLTRQGPFLVWEPGVMVRVGWKYVRLTFQAGFSGDVIGTMPERADLNVGLGLSLFLPARTLPGSVGSGQ
jgi:hypothetical protein